MRCNKKSGVAPSACSRSWCSILPELSEGRAEIPIIAMGGAGAIGGRYQHHHSHIASAQRASRHL